MHVDYPPASLPFLMLPSLAGRALPVGYELAFELEMLAVGGVALLLLGRALELVALEPRERRLRLLLFAASPLLLGPVYFGRYDLAPAALALGAVWLTLLRRETAGAAVAGVGAAVKAFPLLLVPTIAARRLPAGRRARVPACRVVVAAAAAFVFFVPFLARGLPELVDVVRGQSDRPLQVESIGSAFFLAMRELRGWTFIVANSETSTNLVNERAHLAGDVVGAVHLAVLLAILAALLRAGVDDDRVFVRGSAALVAAFVAFNPVLSPQYLIWILPLVLLVDGRRGRIAVLVLVAALALTHAWFPWRFDRLNTDVDPLTAWLVVARDGLLVLLTAVLVVPGRRRGAADRGSYHRAPGPWTRARSATSRSSRTSTTASRRSPTGSSS